ncbi:hypothetical protein C1646_814633 [Rhizophagus diaphanus]|nr:hypothetical protein C1646_814633 [Rhizophagus diaphanus] [Rhizophagus sp. MUCL 43196]
MVADERSRNHKNYQCKTSNSFLFSLTSRFNPILSRVNFEIIWSKNILVYKICISNKSGSFINNIVGKSKQHSYEEKSLIENFEVFQVNDNRLSTLILISMVIVKAILKQIFNKVE